MVAKVTLVDKADGCTVLLRGRQYIMAFPTGSCRDLAEQMAAELNTPGGGVRTDELKQKYRDLKRSRGVRMGRKDANHKPREDDVPESDGVRVEDKKEDIERRIGYGTGVVPPEEVEVQIGLLPMLVDQARAAESRTYRAQREYGAAVVEVQAAWNKVANALFVIGGRHLVDAVLAVGGEGEE